MAVIVTGDSLRIRFFCTQADQLSVNILHFLVGAQTGGPVDGGQLISAISQAWSGVYTNLLSLQGTYYGASMQRLTAGTWNPIADSRSGTAGGTAGVNALPKQTSGLISWRTPLAGRRNRGRVYLPFPAEDDNSITGRPTAPYDTKATQYGNTYLGGFAYATVGPPPSTTFLDPVIYHRDSGGFTPVSGFTVRAGWATQRRRGTFGRPNAVPF